MAHTAPKPHGQRSKRKRLSAHPKKSCRLNCVVTHWRPPLEARCREDPVHVDSSVCLRASPDLNTPHTSHMQTPYPPPTHPHRSPVQQTARVSTPTLARIYAAINRRLHASQLVSIAQIAISSPRAEEVEYRRQASRGVWVQNRGSSMSTRSSSAASSASSADAACLKSIMAAIATPLKLIPRASGGTVMGKGQS